MNTKSNAVLRGGAAAVTGARHVRIGRNGQDAAAVWIGDVNVGASARTIAADASGAGTSGAGTAPDASGAGTGTSNVGALSAGAIVVCDGCGSGESSEVGARLGARLVLGAISKRLGETGDGPRFSHAAFWADVRAEVIEALDRLVAAMPGPREQIVHDYFLFTTVAAVMVDDAIVVWAIGDGVYAIDGRVRELGPFANNQPPYLAYDLVGNPQIAHLEIARGNSVIVATDGVGEVGLDHFAGIDRFVTHPDALRRHLALLARGDERIDWTARRVVRTPAALQDDGAVAMLVRTSEGVS